MDVSVSVSFFQDELASTIEHAVKAAVDTVLCEITKVVGGQFTEFQMEMTGKEKENESLKLRLEISESELKAVRECMNAADADIKQPLRNMNPDCNEQDFQRNENQGLFIRVQVRTDQPHSKEVSEMEAAHISPELPIRWVVSADRTVEIKEEVTELGCDQANERILQEETPPSSITERGTLTETRLKHRMAQRRRMTTQERIDMLTALSENDSDAGNVSDYDSDESWICDTGSSTSESEESATEVPRSHRGLPRGRRGRGRISSLGESSAVPAALPVSSPAAAAGVPTASPAAVPRTATPAASPAQTGIQETGKDGTVWEIVSPGVDAVGRRAAQNVLIETSESLKRHQRCHTGEKPHHCNECGRRFTRTESLKRHQRCHTGEKPHHCNECGRRFTRTESLKRHQRCHTGEKPHHCNECGRRFTRTESLKRHQRCHTGEKPHHCNECGRSFTRTGSLKIHQLIHTGDKPHHCNDCGKCFTQIRSLKKHQQTHKERNHTTVMHVGEVSLKQTL
ncbi:UNVERIFIED_CONTAM: hypothetical protein FKN15_015521 [Acipenser sinensis]